MLAQEAEQAAGAGIPARLVGLGLVQRAAKEGPRWLRKDGWLLIEVDPDAARDVKKVMKKAGFRELKSTQGGELRVTRVVVGRRPS